jgi:hypothetical protein
MMIPVAPTRNAAKNAAAASRILDQDHANISRFNAGATKRLRYLSSTSIQIGKARFLLAEDERDTVPENVAGLSQQVGEARLRKRAGVGIVHHLLKLLIIGCRKHAQ